MTHSTIYGYSDVVTSSYGRGFLTPRDTARQRCLSHTTADRPRTGRQFHQQGRLRERELVLPRHRAAPQAVGHQRVGRRGGPPPSELYGAGSALAPWEIARPVGLDGALATEFTLDLQPAEITDEVRDYAAPSFAPGRPLIEVLRDLTSRIYRDFTYRSGSTTVSTQVNDVLAAGKESVRTSPGWRSPACAPTALPPAMFRAIWPPTRRRAKSGMIGIDATHAWASVWTPQNQWLGLDPTNDQMVG